MRDDESSNAMNNNVNIPMGQRMKERILKASPSLWNQKFDFKLDIYYELTSSINFDVEYSHEQMTKVEMQQDGACVHMGTGAAGHPGWATGNYRRESRSIHQVTKHYCRTFLHTRIWVYTVFH